MSIKELMTAAIDLDYEARRQLMHLVREVHYTGTDITPEEAGPEEVVTKWSFQVGNEDSNVGFSFSGRSRYPAGAGFYRNYIIPESLLNEVDPVTAMKALRIRERLKELKVQVRSFQDQSDAAARELVDCEEKLLVLNAILGYESYRA